MYPASTEAQYLQNAYRYSQGETMPGHPGRRKPKAIDQPALIWSKEYESDKGKGKLLRVIQELSDYMLFNKSGMWSQENVNKPYLIEAAKGNLNPDDYFTAEYTYGDKSNTPIRDNHFYHAAKESLTGQVISQPFQFNCKNISNELANEQIRKASKKAAKIAANMLAEYAAAAGQDLSFIEDPKVDMSGSKDKILAQLKDTEKLEYIIYKLVQDINYRHEIKKVERDCFKTKFDVNAEFAYIDISNGDIRPKSLRPDQVLWIAGKEIETLEDESVVAASVVDYLTLTEILHKYAFQLNTGTGSTGLLDAIDKLQKGSLDKYNPGRYYFSEYYNANGLTSDPMFCGPSSLDTPVLVNYNNTFYHPSRGSGMSGLSYTLLEQKMYFKMIVPKRYVVEINGKKPTEEQYKKWMNSNFDRSLVAEFRELDDNEKTNSKTQKVIDKAKIELWEATRIGHGTLINVGRYEYTTSKKGRSNYVGMPIIAQISQDKSFALLGYNLALWTNIIFNRIEEIVVAIGFTSVILIDEAVETDVGRFLYNAKKNGVALYNSSKFIGGNQSKLQHLDVMKLGNHVEEVNQMLAMVGTMKILYENMIGASPQTQGIQQDYSGLRETQLNIANQSQLAKPKFYEHNMFMNQVLQRIADIAKKMFSRDEFINIRVNKEEHEILKLTKDLDSADPDIILLSGPDQQAEKDLIKSMIMQMAPSGGVEILESLIDIHMAENAKEARAILRQNAARIAEAQQQAQAAQQQMAQMDAQVKAQTAQVPIEVQALRNQGLTDVQEMKMRERENSEREKGNLVDIKNYQNQETELLKSDLRKEEMSESNQENMKRELAMKEADAIINQPIKDAQNMQQP